MKFLPQRRGRDKPFVGKKDLSTFRVRSSPRRALVLVYSSRTLITRWTGMEMLTQQ
jgi:hypothetical protein